MKKIMVSIVVAVFSSMAIPLQAEQHDGTGTMTVSPATANVASTNNSFTFSFLEGNPGKFPDNSVVTISVPSGWTAPQTANSLLPGYVSVAVVGGETIRSVAVSGGGPWTITVTFKGKDSTSGFNVTYAGGGSKVTAPALQGVYTFTTSSMGGGLGGVLTIIGLSPYIAVIDPNAGPHISQRGPATAATGTSTTLAINKPPGTVAGDVMIANIEAKGNQIVPSSLGWTPIAYAPIESGLATHHGEVLYRVADASDSLVSSYTFNLGTGANGASGAIVAFSGVDTTGGFLVGGGVGGPFDVAPGRWTTNLVNSTSISGVTAITTASSNAAVLMSVVAFDNATSVSGFSMTSAGALASVYSIANMNGTVGGGWRVDSSSGSTGTGSATLGSSQKWGAILLALKPAFSPSVASELAFTTPPATTIAGSTMAGVVVQIQDQYGNSLPSNNVPVTVSLSSGSFDGSSTLTINTDASGKATFSNLKINVAGSYTMTAMASGIGAGLTSAISGSFTVSPGPANSGNSVINASAASLNADGTSTLTITIIEKDANGNNLTASGVTPVLNTTVGSLGPVTDNGDGTYTVTLTSSTTVGTANVTGTINGNAIGTLASVNFTAGTTIAVLSSANPSPTGSNVTFTATVSVVAPSTGTPLGTVVFKDGATPFYTNTLVSGLATAAISSLSAGSHTITAEYADSGDFFGSTNSLSPDESIVTSLLQGLTITALGGGSFRLDGAGVAGRIYRLQYADSLLGATWQDLPGGSVTADGAGKYQYTDTSTSSVRFYRSLFP